MTNLLITGGAGFIGRHLYLKARGLYGDEHVFLLDKEPCPDWIVNKDCYFRVTLGADSSWISRTKASVHAGSGPVKIVHLAAEVSVASQLQDAYKYIRSNCLGLIEALHFANAVSAMSFIFASSGSVRCLREEPEDSGNASPFNTYAITKSFGEDILRGYNAHPMLRYAFRFSNVYGPMLKPKGVIGKWVASALARRSCPIYGDGAQRRDFIYVGDVVNYILGALQHEHISYAMYPIGAGSQVSVQELSKKLTEAFEKSDLYMESAPLFFSNIGPVGVAHASQPWSFYRPRSLETGLVETINKWPVR